MASRTTKSGKRGSSPSSRARARVTEADAKTGPEAARSTLQRVEYIAALMLTGRWNGYESRRPLMEAWGLSDSRVKDLSAEAHRRVAYEPQDRDERRIALAAVCRNLREEASTRLNERTGLPDYPSALKAVELETKLLGIDIEPPKRVELTGSGGGPVAVSLDDVDAALLAAEQNVAPQPHVNSVATTEPDAG